MDTKTHFASVAVIFNTQEQILLGKRADPTWEAGHGKWNFPGGGVEFGEDPKDTAIRETREEVGIDIELLAKHPHVYSSTSDGDHLILFVYPAKYIKGEIDISHDPETSEARWFDFSEIKDAECLPRTKEMIAEILRSR